MMKVLSRIVTIEAGKVGCVLCFSVSSEQIGLMLRSIILHSAYLYLIFIFISLIYIYIYIFKCSLQSSGRISVPDKGALDLLCSGSSGDIRSAINSLQFSSFTGEKIVTGLVYIEVIYSLK